MLDAADVARVGPDAATVALTLHDVVTPELIAKGVGSLVAREH